MALKYMLTIEGRPGVWIERDGQICFAGQPRHPARLYASKGRCHKLIAKSTAFRRRKGYDVPRYDYVAVKP